MRTVNRRELLSLAWLRKERPPVDDQGKYTGKAVINRPQCTGCGLCSTNCATGALVTSTGDTGDSYQLLFKQDACTGCGKCAEACPEKCLDLARVEPNETRPSPEVLFEDTMVRCLQCGKPFMPRAVLNRVRIKLAAAGQSPSTLELCPECKVRSFITGEA